MAGTAIHRIVGLFALIGLILLFGGPAYAGERLQGAVSVTTLEDAAPPRTAQTNTQKKSACLHASKHSHESCRLCAKPVVWRFISRYRTKAAASKPKASGIFLQVTPVAPAELAGITPMNLTNGSLSRVSYTSTGIFARSGRLRI